MKKNDMTLEDCEQGEDLEFNATDFVLDDAPNLSLMEGKISQVLEAMMRIGGEVCRLRSEVDELLEHNNGLLKAFEQLKSVIEEKGTLNLDDFDLACDVMNSIQDRTNTPLTPKSLKRLAN